MNKHFERFGLTLLLALAFSVGVAPQVLAASSGGRGGNSRRTPLGTVAGTVRDHRGQPLTGAIVKLLREGASEVAKQAHTAADGSFSARVSPGRYLLSAVAEGFNVTTFDAVQVKPSDELIYRFNLEPLGQGRTTPERRADRHDPKWRIRATQGRRSIFQAGEGESEIVEAIEEVAVSGEESDTEDEGFSAEPELLTPEGGAGRPAHGVIETYAAVSANPLASAHVGTNFAVSTPRIGGVDLIFAGQLNSNSHGRLETTGRIQAGDRHRISATLGGATFQPLQPSDELGIKNDSLGQLSMRAVDEWIVRDGIVVVFGFDYSRFVGAANGDAFSPRLGFEFEANPLTKLRLAYAPSGETERTARSVAGFEDDTVVFPELDAQAVAFVDGRALMERSRRLEFGVERVLDGSSSLEATIFYDTTDGRGVGLLRAPLNGFASGQGEELLQVSNQQGAARGLRIVYARRLTRFLKASAGYSFGRGQQLAAENALADSPAQIFRDGFFQTGAAQLETNFDTGTYVRTVLRFSPRAAVFAIDPFAGRVAVFDPSLSILVTQDLPTFGLPVRAEAVLDARNVLDIQTSVDDGETLTFIGNTRRTVRGGISVRF
ncbi:MAG: TonB-dependent receptor [Acidobacteriota bacterium]|nr:TonB-dependent receptor [Acidobacteriota bacterium]